MEKMKMYKIEENTWNDKNTNEVNVNFVISFYDEKNERKLTGKVIANNKNYANFAEWKDKEFDYYLEGSPIMVYVKNHDNNGSKFKTYEISTDYMKSIGFEATTRMEKLANKYS